MMNKTTQSGRGARFSLLVALLLSLSGTVSAQVSEPVKAFWATMNSFQALVGSGKDAEVLATFAILRKSGYPIYDRYYHLASDAHLALGDTAAAQTLLLEAIEQGELNNAQTFDDLKVYRENVWVTYGKGFWQECVDANANAPLVKKANASVTLKKL